MTISTYNAKENKEVQDIIDDLRRIEEHLKQVEDQKEYLMKKLYNHVNEHERIITVDDDGVEIVLATWKYSKDSKRFDSKAFKEKHTDLYEQFCKIQPGSRTFRLKD